MQERMWIRRLALIGPSRASLRLALPRGLALPRLRGLLGGMTRHECRRREGGRQRHGA